MAAIARAPIAMPTFAPTERPLDFLLEADGVAVEVIVPPELEEDAVPLVIAVLVVAVDAAVVDAVKGPEASNGCPIYDKTTLPFRVIVDA